MMNFQLDSFVEATKLIAAERGAARKRLPDAVLSEAEIERFRADLQEIVKQCEGLSLPSTEHCIARIAADLNTSVPTNKWVEDELHALKDAIDYDIRREQFYHYPKSKGALLLRVPFDWKPAIDAFSPEFQEQVTEAIDCYALGHNLACVFHLMRIMEFGVQRFGRKLRASLITKQPTKLKDKTWHEILNSINPRLTAMSQRTATSKSRYEKYSAIVAYLHAVKDAWRNPTMHPRAEGYTDLQTHDLINHVRAFMNSLAESL